MRRSHLVHDALYGGDDELGLVGRDHVVAFGGDDEFALRRLRGQAVFAFQPAIF